MENLEASPLCRKSDIQVYRPPLDFFMDKVKNNDFFSFTRQMHGLWDAVIAAWILRPELRKIQLSKKDYIQKLSKAMAQSKKDIQNQSFDSGFYGEILEILQTLDKMDKNFLFGISDTGFFPTLPPPYLPEHFFYPNKCTLKTLKTKDPLKFYKIRFIDRQNIIKLLLPQDQTFFDASIWKAYTYTDQIWEFFDIIKKHPVILVGPAHYKDFGLLANFSNYTHISIHGSKAALQREEILQNLVKTHEQFVDSEYPPIYFFVAGPIAVWFVYHLHSLLDNKFLIDVGQAFNFLYPVQSGLLHRDFGRSQKADKGRKPFEAEKSYGEGSFQSSMTIENNEVHFNLNLKFKEIWLEKLMLWSNERGIRRSLLSLRYNFYNLFRNE